MKEYPEDFPWREFLKECIPFAVVLIVYFTVMAAISAPSIAWMIKHRGTEAQRPFASSVSPCLCVKTNDGGAQ